MTFESLVIRFSNRLLTGRTFELIVEPALADLEYDDRGGAFRKTLNRAAVLRAVGGGLADEIRGGLWTFLALMLVPALYYMCLLTICLDFFSSSSASFAVTTGIVVISFTPVLVLFWPERSSTRAID